MKLIPLNNNCIFNFKPGDLLIRTKPTSWGDISYTIKCDSYPIKLIKININEMIYQQSYNNKLEDYNALISFK